MLPRKKQARAGVTLLNEELRPLSYLNIDLGLICIVHVFKYILWLLQVVLHTTSCVTCIITIIHLHTGVFVLASQ